MFLNTYRQASNLDGRSWEEFWPMSRLAIKSTWRQCISQVQDGCSLWSKSFLHGSWTKNRCTAAAISFIWTTFHVFLYNLEAYVFVKKVFERSPWQDSMFHVRFLSLLLVIASLIFLRESHGWKLTIRRLGRKYRDLWCYQRDRRRVSLFRFCFEFSWEMCLQPVCLQLTIILTLESLFLLLPFEGRHSTDLTIMYL